MRVLIVEDDINIREFLKKGLEAETFAVDTACDGDRGSYLGRVNDYDIILLDNGLPKKNGLTVCREIRNAGRTTPIVIVSVRSELPEKIELFRAGADDYILKPFSFEEMIVRIRAILRRPRQCQSMILQVDDVCLDSNTQEVRRGDTAVYLTRKEFALLEYLMRNKGNVLSRGMIMEHVWDIQSDPFSNTIEAHILNLRRKIDTDKRRLIHNVPGRGYKIDIRK